MFSIAKDIDCTSITSAKSYSNITSVGSYDASLITPDLGCNGTIVYDTTNHVFKIKTNNVWSFISTFPGVSGTDREILYYDHSGNSTATATDIKFIQNGSQIPQYQLVFDSSGNTSDNTPTSGLLFKPASGPPTAIGGEDGAVVYGTPTGGSLDFYGRVGGVWKSLSNASGGGTASGPSYGVQFSDNSLAFTASEYLKYYPVGTGPPGTNELFSIGNNFNGGGVNYGNTTFFYTSSANNTQADSISSQWDNVSGFNFEGRLDTHQFKVVSSVSTVSSGTDPVIDMETHAGDIRLRQFRNGSTVRDGSISIQSNTGGINIDSLGNASSQLGGPIAITGTDSDISIVTSRSQADRQILVESSGAYGSSAPPAIKLNSKQQASGGPSVPSGDIQLLSEGGDININSTIGSQSLSNSGNVNVTTENSDINITADGTARTLNIKASSTKVNPKLEVTNTSGTTTITLDGTSGNISNTIGNITSATYVEAGSYVEATTTMEAGTTVTAGTDLIVGEDGTIGNSGNGTLKVLTTHTSSGNPALQTGIISGISQTKVNVPLSLYGNTTANLNPNGADTRRLPENGAMAYDTTTQMLCYAGRSQGGTTDTKYIGNKMTLKTISFVNSLAKNSARPSAPGSVTGTPGYNFDSTTNVTAIMIGNSNNAGGIKAVYCMKVDVPPQTSKNDYSILVEGTMGMLFNNVSGGQAVTNLGIGVWATARPSDGPNPWKFGTDLFFGGGGANTWPRAMHASYYSNLANSEVPDLDFTGIGGISHNFPAGWLNSQKLTPYVDPLGAPSSNGQAGTPNCGTNIAVSTDSPRQIKNVPFSIVCKNVNNSTDIQTQYIWVTVNKAQSSLAMTAYCIRDGFYGFTSTNYNYYGANNTCTVSYVGDNVFGITSDA